jgi:hypothetical protein
MVTIVLVTPFVTRCAGGVAKATSSSTTPSTTLKTPKISPAQTPATAHIPSVARLDASHSNRGNDTGNNTINYGPIINALIGGSATVTAAVIAGLLGGSATVTAAVIAGVLGVCAAVTAAFVLISGPIIIALLHI